MTIGNLLKNIEIDDDKTKSNKSSIIMFMLTFYFSAQNSLKKKLQFVSKYSGNHL